MQRTQLPDYYLEEEKIQRTALKLPTGSCVVLKKDSAYMCERFEDPNSLKQFLAGTKDYPPGIVVSSGLGAWTDGEGYKFNCHSLSVGPFIGLTPEDWLEGTCTELTEHSNPLDIVLEDYFSQIAQCPAQECEQLLLEGGFECNDVVVLCGRISGHEYYVHSGRIQVIDGYPYILSKYGENRVLLTPPHHFLSEYAGEFHSMQVYRHRPSGEQ